MDRICTFRHEQIDAGYHAVGKSPNVQRMSEFGNLIFLCGKSYRYFALVTHLYSTGAWYNLVPLLVKSPVSGTGYIPMSGYR